MDAADHRQIEATLFEKGMGRVTRPRSYWDVVGAHLPLTLITGIALLLPNWVLLNLLPLKPCTFLRLTDYPCPFCGITRSFWAIAEGDWAFAVSNSPLACLLYIAVVLVFAWNITGLLLGVKITSGGLLRIGVGWGYRAVGIISVLIILNWVYRLSMGLK